MWGLLTLINGSLLTLLIYQNRNSSSLLTQQLGSDFQRQDITSLIAIFGVIVVLSICLVTALIAPPNNYDSMTYHMPRVMHWIQNRSVAHYPTHNLRQIFLPPGVSYIVTHLQILSGSDRFANCVQWLAFLGSVIGTSLIAKNFGGVHAQSITALVCASIPMAIMQSTTPQTDLTVSFWLVCFAYFIFRTDSYSKSDLFWLSTSLGLAILAKPTGIIFGMPFLVIFGFRIAGGFLGVRNLKKLFVSTITTGIILLISLSLSFPSFWRNYEAFGKFLGVDFGTTNTKIGIIQLTSNALRNLALNIPFSQFWQLVENIHNYILKIDFYDPATTFLPARKIFFNDVWALLLPDEDSVGNPFHLLLLCVAILNLLWAVGIGKNKKLGYLVVLIIGNVSGFLLFCLLLKWQLWANRLLLSFFILSTPATGYLISRSLSKAMKRTLLILLTFFAILYSLTPIRRPLLLPPLSLSHISQFESILFLNREDIYFSEREELKHAYTELTNLIIKDKCQSVGLNIGENDWEYPIWVLLESKGLESFKIKHINVQNQSQQLVPEFPDSEVCVILEKKNRR